MSGSLSAFFDSFHAAFEQAAARCQPPLESRIVAGGKNFRLRFATPAMQALLLPALQHLVVDVVTPDLDDADDFTLCIWDSVSTGVQPPPAPAPLVNPMTKGEAPELNDHRFSGHVNHDSGGVSFFDGDSRTAIFWMADSRSMPGYDRAAPLLAIFHWCFLQAGRQITHAAAVGLVSGAALLAGRGGSGKSTTAALAREVGLLHLSDDYCVLAGGPPRVFNFYRTMKLHAHSQRLAQLAARAQETAWISDDKNVLLLDDDAPRELPLKMILLPRVTGSGATVARPASAAEALRALAPSSLFQLPGATAATFAFFAQLARQLPAYHLDLGTDPENVAARVRELLEGATP